MCMENFDRLKNQVFNCGGSKVYSISEIAYTVVETLGNGNIKHIDWPLQYKMVETGDVSLTSDKLYNLLQFRPQYDLGSALAQIKSILSLA